MTRSCDEVEFQELVRASKASNKSERIPNKNMKIDRKSILVVIDWRTSFLKVLLEESCGVNHAKDNTIYFLFSV